MWNIQRISFYVENLHLYNNFFVIVWLNGLTLIFAWRLTLTLAWIGSKVKVTGHRSIASKLGTKVNLHAKNQGHRSNGSPMRVQTYRQTNRHTHTKPILSLPLTGEAITVQLTQYFYFVQVLQKAVFSFHFQYDSIPQFTFRNSLKTRMDVGRESTIFQIQSPPSDGPKCRSIVLLNKPELNFTCSLGIREGFLDSISPSHALHVTKYILVKELFSTGNHYLMVRVAL